ncbi:hypothetical protein ACFWWM_35645 [Streptomyces sp. NPDC058682]|nr:hypothetical protein [Streptomyces sp. NBC_01214]MCX4804152.1 hypothetical protein [Streptomyces sp. NBC_01214]
MSAWYVRVESVMVAGALPSWFWRGHQIGIADTAGGAPGAVYVLRG